MSPWGAAAIGAIVGAVAVLVALWVYLVKRWPRG